MNKGKDVAGKGEGVVMRLRVHELHMIIKHPQGHVRRLMWLPGNTSIKHTLSLATQVRTVIRKNLSKCTVACAATLGQHGDAPPNPTSYNVLCMLESGCCGWEKICK